jgi:hypothetical protein
MREIQNIVILTGAGISAESGLATFRAGGSAKKSAGLRGGWSLARRPAFEAAKSK